MKHLLILLFAFGFLACAKDPATKTIDLEAIQAKLKADPDVSKARSLFFEHTKIISTISPDEMKPIKDQLKNCGFYWTRPNSQELALCLKDTPYGPEYARAEDLYREYSEIRNVLDQRYPDFAALDNKAQAGLILYESTKFAEELLSTFLQKKKNEK
jgi:hypothetical protein